MTSLTHFELPARFAERYRPVKLHPRERGLAAFVLDDHALQFYRCMTTKAVIPEQAIWSLQANADRASAFRLICGRAKDALGYVVCQVTDFPEQAAAYPVPRRLGYRTKVAIAAVQRLLTDLQSSGQLKPNSDVIGLIEAHVEQLRSNHQPKGIKP